MPTEKEFFDAYPVFLEAESADSFLYSFETSSGVRYLVKFFRAPYYFQTNCSFCENVFEISFAPENSRAEPDKRIMSTIIELVNFFIIKFEVVVLYVCESLDNKEKFRLRLFEKWFNAGNVNNRFIHRANNYVFEDYELMLGMISVIWDKNFDNYFEQLEFFQD